MGPQEKKCLERRPGFKVTRVPRSTPGRNFYLEGRWKKNDGEENFERIDLEGNASKQHERRMRENLAGRCLQTMDEE